MKKLIAVVVLAAACGGTKGGPADKTTTQVVAGASAKLTITELKFYEGDELGMKLAADGTISIKNKSWSKDSGSKEEWKDLGQLSSDGTLKVNGEVKGQLNADGSFTSVDGKMDMGFKLEGAALSVGDKKITIGDKGIFQGTNPSSKEMRVDGANDDGSKRTALLLMGIVAGAPPQKADAAVEVKAN